MSSMMQKASIMKMINEMVKRGQDEGVERPEGIDREIFTSRVHMHMLLQ